jgi:hypothetical protein
MPVFISHSHHDAKFVDTLASHLIKNNAYVWVDRWELNVGDSLLQKIQEFLKDASALIVVLSKASIQSEWCKKELSAGLIRELEERRVIVLPVLIEDCEIPLLLRDKLYADFRSDFDAGLKAVLKALSKFTSDSLGRSDSEEKKYLHDWGIIWAYVDDSIRLNIMAATHSDKVPYAIVAEIIIIGNEAVTQWHRTCERKGLDWFARKDMVGLVLDYSIKHPIRLLLEDSSPKEEKFIVTEPNSGRSLKVLILCRRLGEDTGMDVLYDVKPILEGVFTQIDSARRPVASGEV